MSKNLFESPIQSPHQEENRDHRRYRYTLSDRSFFNCYTLSEQIELLGLHLDTQDDKSYADIFANDELIKFLSPHTIQDTANVLIDRHNNELTSDQVKLLQLIRNWFDQYLSIFITNNQLPEIPITLAPGLKHFKHLNIIDNFEELMSDYRHLNPGYHLKIKHLKEEIPDTEKELEQHCHFINFLYPPKKR
jgi:hypothetical protein